jgi:hypothetical protein
VPGRVGVDLDLGVQLADVGDLRHRKEGVSCRCSWIWPP